MNAARRALCSELRHQGMTGKQAYEVTKDEEFMRQWIRVSIKDQRSDGKPKRKPKPMKWRSRLRTLKYIAALELQKAKDKKSPTIVRANFIRRMFERGESVAGAIAAWTKKTEKKND